MRGMIYGLAFLCIASISAGDEGLPLLDGSRSFLEPCLTVRLTTPQTGQVTARPVEEGSLVAQGDVLYQLDDAALRAQLAIAEQAAARTSDRDAAAAEVWLKARRLQTLQTLQSNGQAGGEELARAEADHQLALAQADAAAEQIAAAKLEVARIEIELEQRQVRAPCDGIVTELSLQIGESANRSDAIIATLVDVSELKATFYLPARTAVTLRKAATVQLLIDEADGTTRPVPATVSYVAPVIAAESGTMRVRVDLENENRSLRAGSPCELSHAEPDRLRFSARP